MITHQDKLNYLNTQIDNYKELHRRSTNMDMRKAYVENTEILEAIKQDVENYSKCAPSF